MDLKPAYWGLSSCIDLCECHLKLTRNPDVIKVFVERLRDKIKMRHYVKPSWFALAATRA